MLASSGDIFVRYCSEGGFFNAVLSFPTDYPNSPPTCRFTSEMWHPNGVFLLLNQHSRTKYRECIAKSLIAFPVYNDGRVCISILHSPGDDPHGYETASERWSPVQSVRLPI